MCRFFDPLLEIAAQAADDGPLVGPADFDVALIPFTLDVTTLGPLKAGDTVNLETDILAKYVQRVAEAKHWD